MSRPGDSVHPHTRTVRDGGYIKTITEPGLTKRELFAAMIFANGWSPALPAEVAAKAAVVGADALLAELAKDGAP